MENLFSKITLQLIAACKRHVLSVQAEETGNRLWDKDPKALIPHLEACLKLNEAYQEQYRMTKERMEAAGSGKKFEFNERNMFGRFDLFCRRVIKLIDMFSTIDQVKFDLVRLALSLQAAIVLSSLSGCSTHAWLSTNWKAWTI
jgi:dynein heavy chain, axonemal